MDYIPKYLSWEDVGNLCGNICKKLKEDGAKFDVVVPVIKGGFFLSMMVAKNFNIDKFSCIQVRRSNTNLINSDFHEPQYLGCTNSEVLKNSRILICEDIIYSGETLDFVIKELKEFGVKEIYVSTLYNFYKGNKFGKIYQGNIGEEVNWVVFPWDYEHPFMKEEL